MEEAASAMTDHLKELMQLKLAKYLPISVYVYPSHVPYKVIRAKRYL